MNVDADNPLNFSEICRLCLSKEDMMTPIFEEDDKTKKDMPSLATRILMCASLQVEEGDGFPSQICTKCSGHLDNWYAFKEQCHSSDATLRQHLQTDSKIQIISKTNEPTSLSKVQNDNSKTASKKQKKGIRLNAGILKKQSLRAQEHLDENSLKREILSKNDPKVESKAPSSVGKDTDIRVILPCEEVSNTTVGDESVDHSKDKPTTATRFRKQFRCPHCPRTFKNPSYWRDHVATHSGIKNFTCQVCDKGFYSIVKLNIHAKTHTTEKDCLCSTCGKVFKKKCELKKHAQIHSERPLFLCNVCGKSFKTNHYLKSHLMVHSGEKNFVCTVCGKAFTWHVTLVTHSKVHKSERPVSCTLCSKAFKRREVMLKHMRVHTGEKSYKCLFCDRGFTDKWNLTQHVRIHTGDKPYKCDVCNQAFTYNVSLKTHIQQRHPGGAITPK